MGKKRRGKKAKQVTKKVENENFLNMLVCSLALPLTPFPFGLPLSFSFSASPFENFSLSFWATAAKQIAN